AFWMVLAYLPLIFKAYDFTDQQIGFAIGLNSLSSILLILPFGVFSDYFSPKKTLTLGAICFSGYLFLLLILQDFYSVCAAVLLGGVGAAAIRVILMSLYLKLIDSRGREQGTCKENSVAAHGGVSRFRIRSAAWGLSL
ncbi:MAG: MFS transporter, partial [Deltaproteobacteria bacterium]|nr:MFS transporter [Deltaproteobacteria bacterium]